MVGAIKVVQSIKINPNNRFGSTPSSRYFAQSTDPSSVFLEACECTTSSKTISPIPWAASIRDLRSSGVPIVSKPQQRVSLAFRLSDWDESSTHRIVKKRQRTS